MKYLIAFVFILFSLPGFSQHTNELPFVWHLINKGLYEETIYIINNNSFAYNKQQQDSLNYFHGWAHYSLKNLQESTASFLKVRKESALFRKSYFFAAYNQTFLENFDESRDIIDQMNIQNEPLLSLKHFELSGIDMLQGNWQQAKQRLKKINKQNAILNEHVSNLENIYHEMESHKTKSPVLAGIMSGIIPGSGKIYAGETGSGIASMIGTIGFGLITWENYNKRGIKNAKTIIFGSLFAVNYVSNIYGSVISVKVRENEFSDAIHNQILFQLHIPLRNFFE